MKRPRHSSYPMPIEDAEVPRELGEFGYRETTIQTRPSGDVLQSILQLHVVALPHASNDLGRAQAVFAIGKKRRPRGRHRLHPGIRVLQRWPLN